MGEAVVSNELPLDSSGFNSADQLRDELPADFTDFDDETPEELPADFAGFDEGDSPGPSTPDAPPPSVAQSATASAKGLGSSQLLEGFSPEERERILAFTQTLRGTVTHVVPRGTPDPIFSREAARNWDAWRRQRDDRIFRRAREGRAQESIYEQEREKKDEEKREQERRKEWLYRQRQIAHGWAKFIYWLEQAPQDAEAYRQQYEDERGEWLAEIAVSPRFRVRPKAIEKMKRPEPRTPPRGRGMGS
jgi:hypothetical protein